MKLKKENRMILKSLNKAGLFFIHQNISHYSKKNKKNNFY